MFAFEVHSGAHVVVAGIVVPSDAGEQAAVITGADLPGKVRRLMEDRFSFHFVVFRWVKSGRVKSAGVNWVGQNRVG